MRKRVSPDKKSLATVGMTLVRRTPAGLLLDCETCGARSASDYLRTGQLLAGWWKCPVNAVHNGQARLPSRRLPV